ncbi:MAG: hypothetical protein ACE5KT_11485 [Methanosarcinales archaeon]
MAVDANILSVKFKPIFLNAKYGFIIRALLNSPRAAKLLEF